MATLSFGVTGPTQTWTVDLQITDDDAARVLAWLVSPQSGYGVETDVVDGVLVPRQASAEEAARSYARARLDRLLQAVVSWEQGQAAAAAAAQVRLIAAVAQE